MGCLRRRSNFQKTRSKPHESTTAQITAEIAQCGSCIVPGILGCGQMPPELSAFRVTRCYPCVSSLCDMSILRLGPSDPRRCCMHLASNTGSRAVAGQAEARRFRRLEKDDSLAGRIANTSWGMVKRNRVGGGEMRSFFDALRVISCNRSDGAEQCAGRC